MAEWGCVFRASQYWLDSLPASLLRCKSKLHFFWMVDSNSFLSLWGIYPQIGRSTESMIDFVVTDTTPGANSAVDGQSAQSTISRFACRVICERNPPYTARIYAAGFDASRNIFLGVSESLERLCVCV